MVRAAVGVAALAALAVIAVAPWARALAPLSEQVAARAAAAEEARAAAAEEAQAMVGELPAGQWERAE